ncbi:MAG: hypothetical protein WD314_04940 [Trueperaceae bacterium]
MAKSLLNAPENYPCVDSSVDAPDSSKRTSLKSVLPALLVGLLALVLAGCGTRPLPIGIQPTHDGNFLLSVSPSDAEVVVVEEGFETTGVPPRGTAAADGSGELRYDLKPGRYKVLVMKAGYYTVEKLVEITSDGAAEDDEAAGVSLDVVLEVDPDADISDGSTGGSDGSGAGSNAVRNGFSLVGDPNFDVSSLSSAQRLWYERLWAGVRNPNQVPDIDTLIASDDEYEYARLLNQYNHGLLGALRVTGDLRFLDEVDRVAQGMRDRLRDGWCGGVASSYDLYYGSRVYEKDGYLNFRRKITSPDHYCRDVSDLEETVMHGHLASVMYAYHVNRNVPSPSGVDYGERADFWMNYLREHFEAKWRERSGKAWPRMDFINTKFCHTHNQFTLYHYYVGTMLADQGDPDADAYLAQARKMTDQMFDEPHIAGKQAGGFVDVSTSRGPAVVYAFGSPYGTGSPKEQSCPTTYTKLLVEAAVELHMEGFYRWGDTDIMEKLGNGIAHFVMDTDPVSGNSAPLAAGVTGSGSAGGIKPTTYRDRPTLGQANISAFAQLAAWQSDDKILRISEQLYKAWERDINVPRTTYIPASMLFAVSFK